MKEKLREFSLWAEIISSIAVLITLVILIFEVRGNTQVLRSNAYQSQLEKHNNFRELLLSDDKNLEVYGLFLSRDIPEEGSIQHLRLSTILTNVWNNNDGAYAAYTAGMLDGNEWERINRTACGHYSLIVGTTLEARVFIRVSAEFVSYLEENC